MLLSTANRPRMLARSIAIPPIHAPFACGYRRAHTHSRKGPASTSAETTAGHQAAVADVRSSPAFPFFSKRDARFLFTATRPEQYQRLKAPEFTFAGRSNVGKSSLISAVLRSQGLVKTSKKPGHTSALNFFSLESAAYPGQTLTIVDMPGYGFRSRDEWGQFTMEYLSKRKELLRVFMLVEAKVGELKSTDLSFLELAENYGVATQLVLTKTDKLKRADLKLVADRILGSALEVAPTAIVQRVVACSSKTKTGISAIQEEILRASQIIT